MLKDENRKSQFKYDLGKLMGDYAVPLLLGNFNISNKETRRLELWENQKSVWFDLTEFRQPLQVQSHLEMPGILVQLGHIQHT